MLLPRVLVAVLATGCAAAVSAKHRTPFENLPLNERIPFSGTGSVGADGRIADDDAFRGGVFEGPPFARGFR